MSARIAVVDVGSNSTRLLIADVGDGAVTEVERRSTVTRLAEGVDATGQLADAAMRRVRAVLGEYRALIDATGADRAIAVLTSAVRDAANGTDFVAAVRDDYGLDARELSGDEEARLTYLGAISGHPGAGTRPTLVVDVGGGSTELVIGQGHALCFHASTQAGVVRQSERHLRHDPPRADELAALAADARAIFAAAVPAEMTAVPQAAIGVAGTPTSLAAIDLGLQRYDARRIEGHVLSVAACERLLDRLAPMPVAHLREVPGLHPDRASVIVAGTILVLEALRRFGLAEVEVSEHDLLYGTALAAAEE